MPTDRPETPGPDPYRALLDNLRERLARLPASHPSAEGFGAPPTDRQAPPRPRDVSLSLNETSRAGPDRDASGDAGLAGPRRGRGDGGTPETPGEETRGWLARLERLAGVAGHGGLGPAPKGGPGTLREWPAPAEPARAGPGHGPDSPAAAGPAKAGSFRPWFFAADQPWFSAGPTAGAGEAAARPLSADGSARAGEAAARPLSEDPPGRSG